MKVRVYDWPTRVFHVFFATCFLLAFSIAKTVDDDELGFSYHMIAGLVLLLVLLWRLIWGVLGSQHARFSDFSLSLKDLLRYLKGVASGASQKWSGHNPASSWAAVMMMSLALGLGASGILMAQGIGLDILEDLHELLANTFMLLVILHIAGLIVHQLQHKDSLAKSMVTGKKTKLPSTTVAVKQHRIISLLALLLTVVWAGYLIKNFDSYSRTLHVAGYTLHLYKAEDFDEKDDKYRFKKRDKYDDD